MRTHTVVVALFSKDRVGKVIGHSEHRLTVAKNEMFRVDVFPGRVVEVRQTRGAAKPACVEIQLFPAWIVSRRGSKFVRAAPDLFGVGAVELFENFIDELLFLSAGFGACKESVDFERPCVLIEPVALHAFDGKRRFRFRRERRRKGRRADGRQKN